MKIKLKDIGSINNAEIDISKINVVGGVNSSGKSIVSKLLYCYLKSEKDDESLEFLIDVDMMIRKYIPNYQSLPEIKNISSNASDKQKAMVLSNLLQKNFKEMFFALI